MLCLADLAVGVLMFLASHCHHVKQGSRCHSIVGRAAEHWRCILAADILSVAVRQDDCAIQDVKACRTLN